jgi:hypothetical protein
MLKERIYYFIISLFFGLLAVYIINIPPNVIIKHPDINKISNIVFVDEDNDNLCYGLKPELVEC